MKIKGVIVFGKQKGQEAVDQESVQFLQDVMNGLKQLKGSAKQGLELDLEVPTREEAAKKVKHLNNVKKTLGIAYATIKIKLETIKNPPAGSPDFRVTASRSGRKKGGKGKASKAEVLEQIDKAAAVPAGNMEEGIKQLIQQIESGQMPPQVMPGIKMQYDKFIDDEQKKLAEPGISEADAAGHKRNIELMQSVVEAIKKKLGQ